MTKTLYVFWNDCVLSGRIMKTWLVGTNPHSYELPLLTMGNTQEEAIGIAANLDVKEIQEISNEI